MKMAIKHSEVVFPTAEELKLRTPVFASTDPGCVFASYTGIYIYIYMYIVSNYIYIYI